jgi:tetratricopeptide (TPR) repeat protein
MPPMLPLDPNPGEDMPAPDDSPVRDQPDLPATEASAAIWRRLRWLLLLIPAVLIIGGGAGYYSGVNQQRQAQQQAVAQKAQEQFQLGIGDLEAHRYEIARQRFEYVISLDPSYPQAAEKLAEALLGGTAPLSTPTPAASPTPNLAPVQDLLTEAQGQLSQGSWQDALSTLLALRAKDASFHSVEVDGMMYAALRNLGIRQISKDGTLEEGIYNLGRAEQFAPLDHDADNWRSWAQLYLQADSYIGIDWAKAAYNFSQVFLVAPYLRGDAYIKYATAAQTYGDQLIDAKDPCGAKDQYQGALQAMPNGTLESTANKAAERCETATTKPKPPKPTDTPTPENNPPLPTDTPDAGSGGG